MLRTTCFTGFAALSIKEVSALSATTYRWSADTALSSSATILRHRAVR